jgi:nucleoid-associated protein YgaU
MALAIGLARLVEVELDPGAPPSLVIAPPAPMIIDESPPVTGDARPAAPAAVVPSKPAPVDDGRTYVVKAGETLGTISQKVYGTTKHWKQLHEANRDVIPDPARMRAGTKIKLPRINGR